MLHAITKFVGVTYIQNTSLTGDIPISIINYVLEQLNNQNCNPEGNEDAKNYLSMGSIWDHVVLERSIQTEKQSRKIYETKLLSLLKQKAGKESDRLRSLLPLPTDAIMESHEEANVAAKSYFRSKVKRINNHITYNDII